MPRRDTWGFAGFHFATRDGPCPGRTQAELCGRQAPPSRETRMPTLSLLRARQSPPPQARPCSSHMPSVDTLTTSPPRQERKPCVHPVSQTASPGPRAPPGQPPSLTRVSGGSLGGGRLVGRLSSVGTVFHPFGFFPWNCGRREGRERGKVSGHPTHTRAPWPRPLARWAAPACGLILHTCPGTEGGA